VCIPLIKLAWVIDPPMLGRIFSVGQYVKVTSHDPLSFEFNEAHINQIAGTIAAFCHGKETEKPMIFCCVISVFTKYFYMCLCQLYNPDAPTWTTRYYSDGKEVTLSEYESSK
jgi:hypothetical protein